MDGIFSISRPVPGHRATVSALRAAPRQEREALQECEVRIYRCFGKLVGLRALDSAKLVQRRSKERRRLRACRPKGPISYRASLNLSVVFQQNSCIRRINSSHLWLRPLRRVPQSCFCRGRKNEIVRIQRPGSRRGDKRRPYNPCEFRKYYKAEMIFPSASITFGSKPAAPKLPGSS